MRSWNNLFFAWTFSRIFLKSHTGYRIAFLQQICIVLIFNQVRSAVVIHMVKEQTGPAPRPKQFYQRCLLCYLTGYSVLETFVHTACVFQVQARWVISVSWELGPTCDITKYSSTRPRVS